MEKISLRQLATKLWRLGPPKPLSRKKKIVISTLTTLFLTAGLVFGLYLVQQTQEIRKKAGGSDVTLTLNAPSANVNAGGSFTVNVYLNNDTSHYQISAADFTLTYPTSLLTLDKIEAGNFFKKSYTAGQTEMLAFGISCSTPSDCPFKITENNQAVNAKCNNGTCSGDSTIYASSGRARLVLGAPCTTAEPWACYPQTTSDILATLHFKVKATAPSGDAAIAFDALTATVTATGNTTNVLNTTSLNPATIHITGAATPTPTPTPRPDKAGLSFKVKFQGISASYDGLKVRVILKQNGVEKYKVENVAVNFVSDGVYSGSIANIDPGEYDVYIKGWAHLQKKFGPITLTANQTAEGNWSDVELPVGDITGVDTDITDNKVNGADFSVLVGVLDPFNPAPAGTIADLDLDGTVGGGDFSMLVGNLDPFGGGDE